VRNKYQRKDRKSNHKFEIVRGARVAGAGAVADGRVWAEMQAQWEELTGKPGCRSCAPFWKRSHHRVGPPHRPNPTAGCVRWGSKPGYVVFAGQKSPWKRAAGANPRGQEVELESYGQLQQDGKLQQRCRNAWWPGWSHGTIGERVESVLEGYGSRKAA